jgi:hypothetical protein
MEDARFVRFRHERGEHVYYAVYTAFDGRQIAPQLIETLDFRTFNVATLNGDASRNKGMAIFPRKVGGRFVALSRQDNQSNYVMFSDDVRHWQDPDLIQHPERPWELVQLGNCGSPIETEAGWLVITHGVGPMRRYALGAILLDLEDPRRVIGHLDEPLLVPTEDERDGYVPNVCTRAAASSTVGTSSSPTASPTWAAASLPFRSRTSWAGSPERRRRPFSIAAVQAADMLAGAAVVLVRLDVDPVVLAEVFLPPDPGEGLHGVQRGLGRAIRPPQPEGRSEPGRAAVGPRWQARRSTRAWRREPAPQHRSARRVVRRGLLLGATAPADRFGAAPRPGTLAHRTPRARRPVQP